MPFPYGDSYFGLRTFGQSDGTVKDASATISASSTTSDMENGVIAIGSGQVTISASASISCSAESIIVERTDEYAYGSGLYGQEEYTQGDLQTIVVSQSTTTVANGNRIRFGDATVSGASSITILAGFTANADGSLSATSSTSGASTRVRESSATVSASSTTTANAVFTAKGEATVNASATLTDNGAEVIIREDSDQRTYGSWNYGVDLYDQADLQTIVSVTSVDSSATANRVQNASATVNATATNTSVGERIHRAEGTVTSTSTVSANAVIIANASATVTVTSTITFTSLEARIRESGSIVTVESAEVTNAREKWERISRASTLWETIAA